jgi:hypothetical protein
LLLRESSEKAGAEVDITGALGEGDGGIPSGAALIRFGEAVTRGSEDVDAARAALIEAVGRDGFIDAAAIVGIFNGLVRSADSSGIPLDDGSRDVSIGFRETLGLNEFGGANNTAAGTAPSDTDAQDISKVFG